jgi:hypothetical protein
VTWVPARHQSSDDGGSQSDQDSSRDAEVCGQRSTVGLARHPELEVRQQRRRELDMKKVKTAIATVTRR